MSQQRASYPSARGPGRSVATGWAAVVLVAVTLPAPVSAQEPPKLEAPKAPEAPKIEAPKLEAPKLEAPKLEAPKAPEAPKLPAAPAAPAGGAAAPAGGAAATPVPEDANIVLYDAEPSRARGEREERVPKTVPRVLLRNASAGSDVQAMDRKDGAALTIDEIVVSASNHAETSRSAPAWVIVISAKDIRDRGYTELSQVLDDLPGMDIIRPYGDYYFRNYWRGYRASNTDPFLLLIDGVTMNQLYFGDTQILASLPLSNVERIEFLYGPASAVYGANAATGVINVITKTGQKEQEGKRLGTSLDARVTLGGPQGNLGDFADYTKIVDASLLYVNPDYRLRLTTRLESSVLDTSIGERFEYTKNSYYGNAALWGQGTFDAFPDLAGKFYSADRKAGVDARLFLGKRAELAAQYYTMSTGSGTQFAADRVQNMPPRTSEEISVYGQYSDNLSPSIAYTTRVQFRSSSLVSPSLLLDRSLDRETQAPRIEFASYEAPNTAVVAWQHIDADIAKALFMKGDNLAFTGGVSYAHIAVNNGPEGYHYLERTHFPVSDTVPEVDVDASVPGETGQGFDPDDLFGGYLLAKYTFPEEHALHLGVRVEKGAQRDDVDATFRGGYAGTFFEKLTVKLLYGQAFHHPRPFELSRSAGTLENEHAQTLESNITFSIPWLQLTASGYFSYFDKPFVAVDDGAFGQFENVDSRQNVGMDLGARFLWRPFHLWGYYSRQFQADETNDGETYPIGDIAVNKGWVGATFDKNPVTITLLSRFIGERTPAPTNPAGTVPWYAVLDANVMLSDVLVEGLWFAFRASNIIGTRYDHPGVEAADSGNTPGVFGADGSYTGSAGVYNSRLPQPGRGVYLTVGFTLDTGDNEGISMDQ